MAGCWNQRNPVKYGTQNCFPDKLEAFKVIWTSFFLSTSFYKCSTYFHTLSTIIPWFMERWGRYTLHLAALLSHPSAGKELKFHITHLCPGNHLLHLFVGSFKRDEVKPKEVVGMLCWVSSTCWTRAGSWSLVCFFYFKIETWTPISAGINQSPFAFSSVCLAYQEEASPGRDAVALLR